MTETCCPVCDKLHEPPAGREQEPCASCWSIGWRSRPDGVYFCAHGEHEAAIPPFMGSES